MMRNVIFICLLFSSVFSFAQDQIIQKNTNPIEKRSLKSKLNRDRIIAPKPVLYAGAGGGFDFGGVGIRGELSLVDEVSVFLGLGYNFAGFGINTGGIYKFLPEKRVSPLLIAMYGYNAVLIVKNNYWHTVTKKTYYGPSVGIGTDIAVNRKRTNKVSLMAIYPFRSRKFVKDADDAGAYTFPVTFSIGFHYGIAQSFRKSIK
ncbi:MAG: hypothetical protein JST52_04490 [Bacteroidetes bacterium]|nr:hypothetical protein [Bacteroidota bacterium]MBS1738979.1 hypothetical protein [Bacteroidota bacterium]MBS1775478.1 hypothetical protein [Bacteroidota bacterium]